MKKRTIYSNFQLTLCDLLTPVSVYRRLRTHFPGALLLESADYHDRSDSKSFICLEPIAGFEAKGNRYKLFQLDGTVESYEVGHKREVFKAMQTMLSGFETPPNKLSFQSAGFFGFTSYEAVQYMEDIEFQAHCSDQKSNPDFKYHLYRYVLAFDHFKNELIIAENSLNQEGTGGLKRIQEMLQINHSANFPFTLKEREYSNLSDEKYMSNIERGVAHCARGDVFQIVLSREFNQPFNGDDFQVYRALRSINPSPYLFYFDYGSFRIFGSSPESQLQVSNGTAAINPIAGTILRGKNAGEDKIRADELQSNPKERSEHVMLVDLARNDLSKHADEVVIETYAETQYFSHVIHMVSKVLGKLNSDVQGLDIFADTFPAGTLSGAPKYRSMELIDTIENHARNFYGGAIGFLGFDGTVNQAIIIRSFLSKSNILTYQAGAGVVADSTPAGELEEVNNKIAALRSAIKKATTL